MGKHYGALGNKPGKASERMPFAVIWPPSLGAYSEGFSHIKDLLSMLEPASICKLEARQLILDSKEVAYIGAISTAYCTLLQTHKFLQTLPYEMMPYLGNQASCQAQFSPVIKYTRKKIPGVSADSHHSRSFNGTNTTRRIPQKTSAS